jgi:hypothetical protein
MAINLYSKDSVDTLLAAKLSDAPVDGSTYGRKDGAWEVVSGGGGLTINDLSNGATSTLNATAPTTGQALTFDGTDLVWATVGGGSYLPLAGGAMDSTAIVTYSDATYDSEIGGWGFGVELTSDTTQNASIQYNAVSVQDGSGTMTMGPTGLTFPDSTVQTTAASYDAKKAIANLAAACFTTDGTTIGFTNFIAVAVALGSKFQSGSSYLLGIGNPGTSPSSMTLSYSSNTYATSGMMWGSYSGATIAYSDDGGSTWTYADLTI